MPSILTLYYHCLFDSSGNWSGAENTDQKRAINRRKFNLLNLENQLADSQSRACRIFIELKKIIDVRKS